MYQSVYPAQRTISPRLIILFMAVMGALLALRGLYPLTSTPIIPNPDTIGAIYNSLPLYFEENNGQSADSVQFIARGKGYQVFMTPATVAFRFFNDAGRYNAHLNFVGANAQPVLTGELPQVGTTSYMRGQDSEWVTGVQHYGAVRYTALYDGIDAVFYGNPQELQYDFIVAPQADPSVIRLSITDAEALTLSESGDLQITLGGQTLVMRAPYSYQRIDGVERRVESAFVLDGDSIGFRLGAYDPNYSLTIDPVITYSSFFGGSGYDGISAVEVDAYGNVYLAGWTESTQATFPEVVGPDLTFNDTTEQSDIFVAKFAADGTTLFYAGYIGGTKLDVAFDIDVDAAGNAYLFGETYSSHTSFPVKVGPDLTFNGGHESGGDAFITKVNPTGTDLVYSGYIGSGGNDYGYALEVDSAGAVYFTGYSLLHMPNLPDLPLVVGPGLVRHNDDEIFVGKLNPNGLTFAYLGLIGGDQYEHAYDIAVDSEGSAYVVGLTASTDFPVTAGMGANQPWEDAIIFKVTPSGSGLAYSGHIGGDDYDTGIAIDIDSANNVYLIGTTYSSAPSFPVVSGATFGTIGTADVFFTKLNASGSTVYRSRLGGSANDLPDAILVDDMGKVYLGGRTDSTETTFPETGDIDLTHNGNYDTFIAQVSASGTVLNYAGYHGGSSSDSLSGLALDAANNLYVAGITYSSGFPTSAAFDSSYNGSGDGFFTKFDSFSMIYPEMLLNTSFETAGATPKKAANWSNTNPTGGDRRLCSTETKPIVTVNGSCVFQFNTSTAPASGRTLKQIITVPPFSGAGLELGLQFYAEGNKLKPGMKVILTVTYTDDTTAKSNLAIPSGTYAFTPLETILKLTKPVKKVVVSVNAAKVTGRLRLDAFSLSLGTSKPRLPLPPVEVTTRDGVTLDLPSAPDGFRH